MAGRGTLRERGNNKWELTVALGIEGGKQVRKYCTVTANTKREAERLLARFVTDIESGYVGDNRNTKLENFIETWLRDYAEKNLAPKTLFRYKQLTKRIKLALGHLKLEKIKPTHLLSFYNNLLEPGIRQDNRQQDPDTKKQLKGLSERTVLHYHRLLHTVLEAAVQWQYIAINPASRVKPPKVPKTQMACYDDQQVGLMLLALRQEPINYQALVWLAVSTGMRQGEIMGLEWKHIDLSSGTIRVEQAAQYIPGQGNFLKLPKNEYSRRVVAAPPAVMQLLKEHKVAQNEIRLQLGSKWQGDDRVFTQYNGKPMYANSMSNWFPDFAKRHNLPHMNFHGLRHTCASLLIADGATVSDLSKNLGHSNSSTTLNVYSHSFQKANEKLASKMGDILSKATGGSK